MTGWNINHLKMYFLLKIRILQCRLNFQGCTLSPIIMVQWKMAGYLKGHHPIGDTPILTSMIMGMMCKFQGGERKNLQQGCMLLLMSWRKQGVTPIFRRACCCFKDVK